MNKWYRGYIWIALALLFPGIAKLRTAPTVINAAIFFVIGVVIFGSVLSAILFAWDKYKAAAAPPPENFTKAASPEKLSAGTPQPSVDEDRVYAEIAKELETGVADKGLWTRLFAECDGDEKRIKVAYIKQRAAKLKAGAMASALEVVRPKESSHTGHQKTVDVLAAKPLEQAVSSEPVKPPDPRRLNIDKWNNSTIQDCINALFLKGWTLDTNFDGSFVVASPEREKHIFQNKQALQEFMANF